MWRWLLVSIVAVSGCQANPKLADDVLGKLVELDAKVTAAAVALDASSTVEQTADAGGDLTQVVNETGAVKTMVWVLGGVAVIGFAVIAAIVRRTAHKTGYHQANWDRKQCYVQGKSS